MNFKHRLILASSSPRRQFLMRAIGFQFTVQSPDIDESFPDDMPVENVPGWLAEKKASVLSIADEVVVASDTVVILDGKILNKPVDKNDAVGMLKMLAGKTHRVITAVCIRHKERKIVFHDITEVTFRPLTTGEVEFYVETFKPLDKAGAYGAQDCLPSGMNPCSTEEISFLNAIGKPELIAESISMPDAGKRVVIIDHINGSYFTVMGLPIHKVYDKLMRLN